MNNPLRYNGETFYQSSYLPGDGGTILQVVRNPGLDHAVHLVLDGRPGHVNSLRNYPLEVPEH